MADIYYYEKKKKFYIILSPLNYNVIKCLSAELIIFLIKNSNYWCFGDIRGVPGDPSPLI